MASKPSARELQMQGLYDQDVARVGAAGNALLGGFQAGIQEDPRAAYERAAGSAFSRYGRNISEGIRDLRGQQVGMGRLKTGFATDDEDDLYRNITEDFSNTLADRALQAEGLNQNRLGMMGGYGTALTTEALGARVGEYQTLRAQRMQDEADRRKSRGSLIGSLAGVAGTILAGPVGGAVGGYLGKKLGG